MDQLLDDIDQLITDVNYTLPSSRNRSIVITHLEDARYRLMTAIDEAKS